MNRNMTLLPLLACLFLFLGSVSAQVNFATKPAASSLSADQLRKLVPVTPSDSGAFAVKMATLPHGPAVAPTFPGGDDSLMAFLSRNIRYPEAATSNKIAGMVLVGMLIDETGKVGDIRLRHDIGGGCGAEAVRVVSLMPRWEPARDAEGHPVKSETLVPVRFQMDNTIPEDVNLDPNRPDENEGDFDF